MGNNISSPKEATSTSLELQKLDAELAAVRRRLSWLTTAVFLVALSLLLEVATVFGYIVDYHAGESKLVAGACAGGTAMGFLFGWLARRAARF